MQHKTVSIQARVDIVSFANLVKVYENSGIRLRSKSDAIWQVVEQMVALMEREERIEDKAETVEDAVRYLDSINLSVGTNRRATKDLVKALADESAKTEGMGLRRVSKKELTAESPYEDRPLTAEERMELARKIAASLQIEE